MFSSRSTARATIRVEQPDAKKLNVTVENFPVQDNFQNLPHYQALVDGVRTVV